MTLFSLVSTYLWNPRNRGMLIGYPLLQLRTLHYVTPRILRRQNATVTCVALSSDHRFVFSGAKDGSLAKCAVVLFLGFAVFW